MPCPYKTAREYVEAACGQIRWKKARDGIRQELENHISDQCSAYVGNGMSEAEALEKAVEQMGDPVGVGAQLDRLHRPKPQPVMLILVFTIVLSGLVLKMLVPELSFGKDFFMRQTVSVLLGTAAMLGMYFLDYSIIGKYPKSLFWGVIVICVLMFSAEPRLSLSSVSASVSLLLPVAFTGVIFLTRNRGYFGILICLAALSLQTLLCFMIPELTCAALVFLCGVLLTGFAILKNHFNTGKLFSFLLLGAFIIIAAFVLFHVCLNGHAPMRLKYALSPQDYPTGGGWLSLTIREALANARFIGRGGETQALTGLLAYGSAELSSDLMLFYLIHRYGWVSFIVITALFVLFFGKAMRSCARLKSVGGKYVSIAVLLALGLQFVFYCTSNLGFNLFSPLFLPFFSGRAATVIDLGLVGLMLSAFRNDCAEKTVCACPRESRFSLSDGRLIINLNP